VPAVMELLGAANWWLPKPLARLLPASSPHPAGAGAGAPAPAAETSAGVTGDSGQDPMPADVR